MVRQCMADIRINDVPILRQNADADVSAEMPINHHIEFSGSQTLTVKMHPLMGDVSFLVGALCEIEIWRCDGSKQKIIPIEQVCSSSLIVEETETMLPFKYDKKMFVVDVPYRILRWGDCVELPEARRIAPMVSAFYQKIGQMLANKQFSQYAESVRDRELNICHALYLNEIEVDIRNQSLFDYLNSGFTMQPLKGGKRLQLYADKRIVTVLDEDTRPALRFLNHETGEALAVELLLGVKKGQRELSII